MPAGSVHSCMIGCFPTTLRPTRPGNPHRRNREKLISLLQRWKNRIADGCRFSAVDRMAHPQFPEYAFDGGCDAPYGGGGMKLTSIAALLFAVQMASVPALADGTIKEADYPAEYEVVNTSKTGKRVIEKQCSMTLRDRAKTNVDVNVTRTDFGSCHVLEKGKVYRGRENQKQNQIELVILVGEDKARVENWQIVGTVTTTPSPTVTSGSK